ncbi:ABC transporter permease subunit, partial [Klebsiella michiganensis]|uniref:ABC transporter permease subunit n=1 Tax=Klebsiella michiganensis TaxID=1134687 RepID=UPI001E5EE9FB
LPSLTLGAAVAAVMARFTRASFVDVLHEDYMRTARAKGVSETMASRRPVSSEIASRFMPTFWLTLASMSWAVIFGMAAGIVAAVWRNRWPDRLGMALAVTGISFPAFALGMLLMQVFSVELGWLPTVGADSWRHYILPSLTLGAAVAAVMARFTRASFVDVLHEDYMRTARAKGVSET